MHYFSIHTLDGEHLGFLIMLADCEHEKSPQSGRFLIKLQSENHAQNSVILNVLETYQNAEEIFTWQWEKDHVNLIHENHQVGYIRNEYLTLAGHILVLNDLTETI